MPRLNLYLPTESVRRRWEIAAKKKRRSLSEYIRIAVEKQIESDKEDANYEADSS